MVTWPGLPKWQAGQDIRAGTGPEWRYRRLCTILSTVSGDKFTWRRLRLGLRRVGAQPCLQAYQVTRIEANRLMRQNLLIYSFQSKYFKRVMK